MTCTKKAGTGVFLSLCLAALATSAWATTLQRLSFEELTDNSDVIVSGKVMRSWTAWDAGRRYIWTHYEVEVASTQKGAPATTVRISELGGAADGMVLTVAGSVAYKTGDEVLVFAQRMPNGLVRTTGWGQGKYTIDSRGRLRAEIATKGVEYVDAKTSAAVTPASSLDGLTLQEAGLRVAARLRSTMPVGGVK